MTTGENGGDENRKAKILAYKESYQDNIEQRKAQEAMRRKNFDILKEGIHKEYVGNRLDLKDRQADSICKLANTKKDDYRYASGYFHACTGFGKTYLMKAMCEAYAHQKGAKKIVVLEENVNILAQAREDLCRNSSFSEEQIGEYSKRSKKTDCPIIVCTYASMGNLVEEVKGENIGMVLCDEAHHVLSKKRRNILKTLPNAVWYGFTATPNYDDDVDRQCGEVFGAVVDKICIRDAVNENLLSELKTGMLVSKASFNLDGCRSSNGRLQDDKVLEAMNKQIEKQAGKKGLRETIAKFVTEGYDDDLGEIKDKTILINVPNIKEAEDLSQVINDYAGARVSDVYHEKTTKESLQQFDEGKLRVLIQVQKLGEGYNNPNIEVVINYPTGSRVREEQRSGRCLRYNKHNPDKVALVLDVVLLSGDETNPYSCARNNGQVLFADILGEIAIWRGGKPREQVERRQGRSRERTEDSLGDEYDFQVVSSIEILRELRCRAGESIPGEWDEKDISWTDLMRNQHEHWDVSLKQDGKALGVNNEARRTVLGAVWKILKAEEKLVWVSTRAQPVQVVRGEDGGKAIEDALETLKELKKLKRLKELERLRERNELKDPKEQEELKELKRLNELKDPKEQEGLEKLLELKDLKKLLDRKELEELLNKSITVKISKRQEVGEPEKEDISWTDLVYDTHEHRKIVFEQDGKPLGVFSKERRTVLSAVWKILNAEGKLVWVSTRTQPVQVVRGEDGGKAIEDALETLKELKKLRELKKLEELKDPKEQEELKKLKKLEELEKLLDWKELEELLDKSITVKISERQEVVYREKEDISWNDLVYDTHEHRKIVFEQDGKPLGRRSKERRVVLRAVWKILEAEEKLVWVSTRAQPVQVVRGEDGGKAIEDALETLKELKKLRELKKLEELKKLKDPKEQEELKKLKKLEELEKLLDWKELEELLDKSITVKISERQEVVYREKEDISWSDLVENRHEHWDVSLKQDGKALGANNEARRTVLGAVWKILNAEGKLVWVSTRTQPVQVVRGEDGGKAIVDALKTLKELKKLRELKKLEELNELKDPKEQEELKKLKKLEELEKLLDWKELEELLDKSITLKISKRENAMTREQQQAELKRLQDAAEQAETPEQQQKYQEQAQELFAQMRQKQQSGKSAEKQKITFPSRSEGR